MKLSQKGIILVAFPLFFEIAFVLMLMHMLVEADRQIANLAKSELIIAEANSLTNSMMAVGTQVVMFRFTHKESLRKQLDATIAEFPESILKLKQLCEGDPRRMEHVMAMESQLHDCNTFIAQYRRKVGIDEGGFNALTIASQARDAERSIRALQVEVKKFTEEEKQAEDPEAAKAAKQGIMTFLCVIMALNVFLSIALAIFFSKSITGRLAVLRENALLLASRKPLNKPLSGNDEINYLDSVFHRVAEELQQAERRKQEFVAMISHDLRTPLTALQGTLALFAKGTYGDLSDRALKRVSNAEGNVFRLITLINQLLDIDKIEAGMLEMHLGEVQTSSIVEKAIESIKTFAEQNEITLKEFEPSKNLLVRADEDRIEQVLINLLSNAIKYSPASKSVKVRVLQTDNFAEIQVIDEGLGIPEDSRQRIFERFETIARGKEKHASTGLGLAICKAFVEAHGGNIGVRSIVGQGSTFWFSLPLSEAKE